MKKLIYLIPLAVLMSCDLQGVEGEDIIANDSIKTNQNDNAALDENGFKLADSINGVPNEMVMMRADGLRVEWTKKNTDNQIQLNDAVMVNFKARVAGGEQYDSNDPLGEPVPLKTNIGMMVKGWEEGLLMMHVGDKGRIMIPNALGYGEDGYLDKVPPRADLIIDIEIVSRIEPIVLEEGVKVYKYKTVTEGKNPVKNQLITFDYFAFTVGKEGHLYDNSYKHGEPFSFKFENAGVVEGLHQGMSVIKAGENAFIEIPAELAYGKQGLIDFVPSKTDIVYDVRVISVE
jgi:peptidylprolyl isomerase